MSIGFPPGRAVHGAAPLIRRDLDGILEGAVATASSSEAIAAASSIDHTASSDAAGEEVRESWTPEHQRAFSRSAAWIACRGGGLLPL